MSTTSTYTRFTPLSPSVTTMHVVAHETVQPLLADGAVFSGASRYLTQTLHDLELPIAFAFQHEAPEVLPPGALLRIRIGDETVVLWSRHFVDADDFTLALSDLLFRCIPLLINRELIWRLLARWLDDRYTVADDEAFLDAVLDLCRGLAQFGLKASRARERVAHWERGSVTPQ